MTTPSIFRKIAFLIFAAGSGSFLAAQTTCPGINLLTTPRIMAPPLQTVMMLRQPDTSFTGYFAPFRMPILYGSQTNVQAMITSCETVAGKGSTPFSSYARAGWSSIIGDAADFNGDGTLDAVFIPYQPVQLFEALIAPSGVPLAGYPVGIALPAPPLMVRAVDVNKDGKPDLIVVTADAPSGTSPGAIYVLLNNGSGGFQASTRYPAGTEPLGFAVADVNNDGNVDLIVADQGDSSGNGAGVAVLFGNGSGSFSSPTILRTTSPAKAVVLGDFNGDKILDIAAASGPVVSVFPGGGTGGNGNGVFGSAVTFPSGGDSVYLAMGDFNQDGKLDLVVSNFLEQTAAVLLNTSSGSTISFAPQVSYPISKGRSPDFVSVTDFNNDGIPDIIGGISSPTSSQVVIAGNSNNAVDVLLGKGDGTFAPFPVAPLTQVSNTSPIAFAITGDFNNDGKQDVVAMSQNSTTLLFYAGHGDGSYAAPVSSALGSTYANATGAVAGDFNGDGVPDLAIVTTGGFAIALSLKNGTFQPLNTIFKSAISAGSIALGDYNGDGKLDVATPVCSTTGGMTSIHVYDGNGAGGFTDSQPITLNYCPSALLASDLNGDKKPDLVSLNDSGGAAAADVILNQGLGVLASPKSYALDPTGSAVLTLLDANGDGSPDLVSISGVNRPYSINTLLNNGNGTFAKAVSTPVPYAAQVIVGADLNGDKKGDLIYSPNPSAPNDDTYDLLFAVGNGDGTFQAPVHLDGPDSTGLQLADFNGDGRPDLLATSTPAAPQGYFLTLLTGAPPSAPMSTPLSLVNGASFTANAPLSAESIASAFGSHLAVAGNTGGTIVAVMDAAGTNRNATIFYASPIQVNFEIPAGTSNGAATVTVTASDGTVTTGTVQIVNVAPGMFAANAAGLYAGSVLVVSANGTQTPLNNYQLDANQNVIPLPVSLSPASNQVFLIMYGTGIRHASAVTATVGGHSVPVAFAGAQGAFIGEDQVNIGPLPSSLAGAGLANIIITADGQVANTVNVTIQ